MSVHIATDYNTRGNFGRNSRTILLYTILQQFLYYNIFTAQEKSCINSICQQCRNSRKAC